MYVCGRFGEWRRAIPDNPTATLKPHVSTCGHVHDANGSPAHGTVCHELSI